MPTKYTLVTITRNGDTTVPATRKVILETTNEREVTAARIATMKEELYHYAPYIAGPLDLVTTNRYTSIMQNTQDNKEVVKRIRGLTTFQLERLWNEWFWASDNSFTDVYVETTQE